MEEEVRNQENDSKKKWLWLLLLLLLIIFVGIATVIFLKDSGEAEAIDNLSNGTNENQVSNYESEKNKTDETEQEDKEEKVQTNRRVATAAVQVPVALNNALSATSTQTPSGTGTPATPKVPVTINGLDKTFFNEAVIIELIGSGYTATITDTEGNDSNYESKTTISEDGKYTLTVKESDGTEKKVTFVIDTTNPKITGVEDGKIYNVDVTPVIEDENLDSAVLTKNGEEVEYTLGDAITEEGTYILTVTDKAGNEVSVSFVIDTTKPVIILNGESVLNHLEAGIDTYTELGAVVTDNLDEDKTLEKQSYINLYILNDEGEYAFKSRVDNVDTKVVGRYNLVYTAVDAAGNEAKK